MRFTVSALLVLLPLTACNRQEADNPETKPQAPAAAPSTAIGDGMSFVETPPVPDDFKAPEFMQLQVALDALGFSPGIVDGKMGLSTRNAISAFQEQSALPVTGKVDEATTIALNRTMLMPATRVVVLPAEYASLVFTPIPETAEEKAEMENLGYESMWEKLAERFHTTREVLLALNPQLTAPDQSAVPADKEKMDAGPLIAAGTKIRVPNIGADKIVSGSVNDEKWQTTLLTLGVGSEQPEAAKIVVDKSDGTLKAYDAADKLIAGFTATIGSKRDPLPIGEWKIKGESYNPPFSYDPTLLWDVPDHKEKLQLPPGPNGPVGVAWIALSKKHYGIHGTPDPETIGRAQSHGCVRLTNWDVARLAQMVSTKTKVIFQV